MHSRRTLQLQLLLAGVVLALCVVDCAADEEDPDLYYTVLGLTREASDKQIKRAFRKLSLKFHPDKNPGNDDAKQKYQEITEAYDVLSDPDKRQVYDIHGKEGLKKQQQGMQQHDPFGGLFGGGGMRSGMRKGPNFKMKLEVTLEDLYRGGEKSFNIKRKVVCRKCRGTGAKGGETRRCKACGGKGSVMTVQQLGPGFNIQMQKPCDKCGGKGKTFKHKCDVCSGRRVHDETKELRAVIERGMPNGHEIVFERMSEQSPDTMPGDVVLEVDTKRHQRFKRKGDDLHHEMTVSLKEALLGFEKKVLHLDDRWVTVKREDVTYPGQVITLRHEGMPKHNFPSEKGHLYVKFTISFPKKLTDDQKEGIRKLL